MRILQPLALTAVAGGAAVYSRSRLRNWGATREEIGRTLPGDELVGGGGTTMATTIHAPREIVWAWLVQMGADKAGFYSWDRLDNGGKPSAEMLRREWQRLRPGDRILSVPDGHIWFDVAIADAPHTLVLRASLKVPSGTPYDPAGPRPEWFSDSTWTFHLEPCPEGTRLLTRTRAGDQPHRTSRILNFAFWEPAHFIMQTKQFRELKRRAEGMAGSQVWHAPSARSSAGSCRHRSSATTA